MPASFHHGVDSGGNRPAWVRSSPSLHFPGQLGDALLRLPVRFETDELARRLLVERGACRSEKSFQHSAIGGYVEVYRKGHRKGRISSPQTAPIPASTDS